MLYLYVCFTANRLHFARFLRQSREFHLAYFCGEAVDSTLMDVAAEPRVFTSHDFAGPPISLCSTLSSDAGDFPDDASSTSHSSLKINSF